jgi:hypothetical protein
MSAHLTSNTEASILARILESEDRQVSPDVARYLLGMRLPAEDRNG